MRKTYQICCGVYVHKTFLVATIVKTNNNIPHYEKSVSQLLPKISNYLNSSCSITTVFIFVWNRLANI